MYIRFSDSRREGFGFGVKGRLFTSLAAELEGYFKELQGQTLKARTTSRAATLLESIPCPDFCQDLCVEGQGLCVQVSGLMR